MVGAGRFERPTPCAQDIGCPHLGINRFNNLRTWLVGPCGNFSYNLDCKAAIRLVKPPTTPTGSPAGSADCEINQRGRAHVVATDVRSAYPCFPGPTRMAASELGQPNFYERDPAGDVGRQRLVIRPPDYFSATSH